MKTIQNKFVSLSVDGKGRLVSLKNKVTGSELIMHREAAEGWRLVIPSGRHTLDFLYASWQKPKNIAVSRNGTVQTLSIAYDELNTGRETLPVRADFSFELTDDAPDVRARVSIQNNSARQIDEVEFPVVGGLGGFKAEGTDREIQLVVISKDRGYFQGDVLNHSLPQTGRESDQFCSEQERALWEDQRQGQWGWDFYGATEGLYVGYHTTTPQDFVFKVERYPKSNPNGAAHFYPPGTKKWLRFWGIHVAEIAPGASWTSEPVTLDAHQGVWHTAADFTRAHALPRYKFVEPPAWMNDFVGWTEIIGNLYTGEVFHDFKTCADRVIADKKVTGLDLLFYYGHTNLGAEGADYDQSPSAIMGGEEGFAQMVQRLHEADIRIMLLDHLHRYVNREVPEYKKKSLERFAMRNADGSLFEARWWKETALSCRRLAGPTPVWIEMCPACREWQEHYLDHVRKMVARGVDGLELDCFDPADCHSHEHGHAPGEAMLPVKLGFMKQVRAEIKKLNPDFVFIFETMTPATREAADGWYPLSRYQNENGRFQRYLYPMLRQQAVRVGNYDYDSVNKALQLGIGVETEIWGLRKTTLDGCPELAKYVGQVNALRRQYGEILIHGEFRDTLGAQVQAAKGQTVYYSVLDGGTAGKALVLRNPTPNRIAVSAALENVVGRRLVLERPGKASRAVKTQTLKIALGPYEAAVLLACRS